MAVARYPVGPYRFTGLPPGAEGLILPRAEGLSRMIPGPNLGDNMGL